MLSFCDAEYLTEGLASWTEIPSDSVNFVFSQSVLECIFKEEFLPILSECRRVMLPNSIASHVVDLRDLLGDSLNNLRFSEQLWESYIFRSSGFYSNRIRYSDMLNEFNLAGFEVENTVINRWENMPMPRKKLALPFRNIPEDELRIREFEILLRAKKRRNANKILNNFKYIMLSNIDHLSLDIVTMRGLKVGCTGARISPYPLSKIYDWDR